MKRTPGRWAALTVAAGLALAGCATGTNTDPESADRTPSSTTEAELSGTLSVMGFGAGDEVATAAWTGSPRRCPTWRSS